MSNRGRPKSLPSKIKSHFVSICISLQEKEKLDKLCSDGDLSYSAFFRLLLHREKP
jgi:hypothetical protein